MLQTKHVAIKQLVCDLLLWGNSFMYIKRKDGKPEKLIYLQHGDVQVDYIKEQDLVQYNVCNHNAIPKLVKKEDMIHFAKDTYDGINGRGFMYFASDIINLAEVASDTEWQVVSYASSMFYDRVLDFDMTQIPNGFIVPAPLDALFHLCLLMFRLLSNRFKLACARILLQSVVNVQVAELTTDL